MAYVFGILLLILLYTYVGYGVLLFFLRRFRRRPRPRYDGFAADVTLLVAAHNEQLNIGRKITNALSLNVGPHELDILVVSDGSTDGTVAEARGNGHARVRVIDIRRHVGKAAALNRGLAELRSDVVVFTDANSAIEKDSIVELMKHFADPSVGGVCGRIGVPKKKRSWIGHAEALYWRYDHSLKMAESDLGGAVSAQGALYAIRRDLIGAIPAAVADDSYNSLRVVALGKRLVFEPSAVALETVSPSAKMEFGRRVRSTERGWRSLMLNSELFNPGKFGFYSLQLFSHKVLRRLSPFLLVGLATANLLLVADHVAYALAAAIQACFYLLAIIGWWLRQRGSALTSLPFFFVMGHYAMALGLLNILFGKQSAKWRPVRMDSADT